jgi:hypothetical protein
MADTALNIMGGVHDALSWVNRLSGLNRPLGVVRSVNESDRGGSVAVLGFEDIEGPFVLVGTVTPDEDTDTILKLTTTEARAFGIALLDSADDAEGVA